MSRWHLVVVCMLAVTVAAAQSPQAPPRDVRAATKASGAIRGRLSIENTAIFDRQVQERVRQVGRGYSVREGERVSLELPATAGW